MNANAKIKLSLTDIIKGLAQFSSRIFFCRRHLTKLSKYFSMSHVFRVYFSSLLTNSLPAMGHFSIEIYVIRKYNFYLSFINEVLRTFLNAHGDKNRCGGDKKFAFDYLNKNKVNNFILKKILYKIIEKKTVVWLSLDIKFMWHQQR